VLELVEGPTVADRIAHGPFRVSEALAVARQVVDALQAAHNRNVVHRDLKPANIKVRPDGTVKVLDFGLAKALAPEVADGEQRPTPTLTARGVILGTVPYMAPEQARGQASDARIDIWAFGATLYEMLTGRSPFAAESLADTVGAVLYKEPQWDDVPERVQPLLRRCLEKDPARRLRTMADVRACLEDSPAFDFSAPTMLFENRFWTPGLPFYDVSADGRFLIIASGPNSGASPIHVVLNGTQFLTTRTPRE
jgi:eukaryotic-like serine/threonine-protein kinase